MTKRSCPKPEVIASLLIELRKHGQRMHTEYDWLFGMSHDRTVGDDVKVRSHAADPTGGLIASEHKRKARRSLEDAYEILLDSLAEMKRAESMLLHTLDRFDPPERPDAVRYPRTATNGDLEAARAARARRQQRGDGVPR